MTRTRVSLIFAFLIFFQAQFLFTETITDRDFGFSLDIPEGFEIADYTQDGMSYIFSHPNIPVTLVMKITEEPMKYEQAGIALDDRNQGWGCDDGEDEDED